MTDTLMRTEKCETFEMQILSVKKQFLDISCGEAEQTALVKEFPPR